MLLVLHLLSKNNYKGRRNPPFYFLLFFLRS
nr:MAG TPA: hypothetical protein [Caudoviricetes sp.]